MKNTRISNRGWKRVISAATAIALVSNAVLFPEFTGFIRKISNIQLISTVSAADELTIGSIKALVDFSYRYKEDETYAAVHQFDTIKLALTGDTSDMFQYDSDGTILKFQSIGTEKYPFGGIIYINSVGSDEMNIDTAFFDYVYDYAVITGDDNKHLKILTTSNHNDASLANHVVHDSTAIYEGDDGASSVEDQSTIKHYANWMIETANYTTGAYERGSLIGELGQVVENVNRPAKVTINYINNATGEVVDAGNAGTICGKINGDSVLTVQSTSGSQVSDVTSGSGNAGGLVGEMLPGSELNITGNSYMDPAGTITAKTSGCFAGGIVGKNDSATVNSAGFTTISNTITGDAGAGGIFGYYKPIMTSNAYSLNTGNYSIGSAGNRCNVSSPNGAGGLFGVLDNPGGVITISGDNTIYVQGNDNNTILGGVVGSYQASSLSDSLFISGNESNLQVNADKSGNLANYGGIIGSINGAWFASVTNAIVNASNADDEFFGGAVGTVDTGYVYVKNIQVTADDFHGGGIVGHTNNGVVHLAGTANLSAARANTGSVNYGQIVGYRDNALVFAESDWTLTRYIDSSANKGAAADDIGSWGEVVRFKTGTNALTIGGVLDKYYNPSDSSPVHYAKLKAADSTLSNITTFALAALNMQLNNGVTSDTAVLQFADVEDSSYAALKETNFSMTDSINLSLTGITGLTRDNKNESWTSGISAEYNGTSFSCTSGKVLTLAIGEGYEGNNAANTNTSGRGRIYRHRYNGLFGELTNDFTVSNVTINGQISTYTKTSSDFYVGSIAGNAKKSIKATNVKIGSTSSDMNIDYGIDNVSGNNVGIYVGGLVGNIEAPGTTIIGTNANDAENAAYSDTVNSTFQAIITGGSFSDIAYVGGIAGYVGSGTIKVYDVEIGGKVENTAQKPRQKIGGLFANIAGGSIELDGITASSLTVSGKMGTNNISGAKDTEMRMGGLLGYCWNAPATFDHVTVSNCTLNNQSTGGDMAGLVNMGTGYWKFQNVDINGLTLNGTAASSLGMLVNKAWIDANNAMYLELPSGYTYKIQNVTSSSAVTAATVYDEIVAYSKIGTNSIEANGNSVISINTTGETTYGKTEDTAENGTTVKTKLNMTSGNCNTYQNQVIATGFNKYNPNTRYYYNLDNYKDNESNSAAENLLVYSVNQYAHSSISSNFVFHPADKVFSGSLDLNGYSYYPFDLSENVSISGTLKLYNAEIEAQESNEVANKGDSNPRSTRSTNQSQHYLMHAGLFRNVNSTVTVSDSLSLEGNVAAIDSYCGALICGSIAGDANNDAKFDSSTGSISLNGIRISNYDGTGAKSEYAPLLINTSGGYVVLNMENISASAAAYTEKVNNVPTKTDFVATSLLGRIGSDTQKVKIKFNNVKLDGRKKTNSIETSLTDAYGTVNSIFSKATLLESLTYAAGTGSSGIYNYEYGEDWNNDTSGNPKHEVTYGSEISDTQSKYKKLEYWYNNENHTSGSGHYTDPLDKTNTGNSDASAPYDFSGFLPYVYISCGNIVNATLQRQLDVNHTTSEFDGCGTYNHPYTITADSDLETIAFIIANNKDKISSYTISLPSDITTPTTWCQNKNSCKKYTLNSDKTAFVCTTDSSDSKDFDAVRKYLAGAYYYLNSSTGTISLSSSFVGLGSTTDDFAVFRGVIAGNNQTIINQSGSPLIYASNGSVVRKLKVQVGTTENPVVFTLYGSATDQFSTEGGCGAYGAVFGRVFGGDNILDEVKVDLSHVTITPSKVTPVGGYVGVIVEGGVIFRNMDDTHVPKADKAGFGTSGLYAESDKNYLYCNPLIGRVISGFAVNEASAYAPYENGSRTFGDGSSQPGTPTTLKNGNKNYSITDIKTTDSSKLSVSGSTVTVPNSQAFFIMSLIINCGMGTNKTHVIGYYDSNQITRHAKYDYVGSDTSDQTSAIWTDYLKTNNDLYNGTPYILDNCSANAGTLGSGSGFTVNVGDDIILPDGYKGIGNVYNNSTSLYIALSTFNGNNHTISQNTTFYSYTNDNKKNQDNYLPYTGTVHGLGLFNYVNNATFKDCILTGNVIAGQYHSGSVLNYNASTDFTSLSAGSLAGTLNMSGNATVSDVYLNNVYVESTRDAAGMIGYMINAGKRITITNKAETADSTTYQSSKIYVNAGTNAAGMIARQGNAAADHSAGIGDINIDLNNHYFDYSSIVSRYNGTTEKDKWNADWTLAVGGLVGVARANNKGSSANTISISNVKIGKPTNDSLKTISCQYSSGNSTTYGNIYVGGLVGVFNRCPVNITNCEVYNVNVSSGKYAGGLVGWGGTDSEIIIDGCKLSSTLDATVYSSTSNAGGVLGFCKYNGDSDNMGNFTIRNSTIDGYIVEGAYAGGALGDWQAGSSRRFAIQNSAISNCTVKYSTSGGGIAGQLQRNLFGYNVRVNDITFTQKSSTKQQGYIAGNRGNNGTIKITSFHRTGAISEAKLIGNKNTNDTMANLYGTGGYVIFADFDGSSLTPSNSANSSVNYDSNTHVSDYGVKPYITINPSIMIDDNKFTGDAFSTSAVNSILTDTTNKKYTVAPLSSFVTGGEVNTEYISSFSEEFDGVISDKTYDFPLLIVNDDVDNVVNNYIRVLTNTESGIDFSNTGSSGGTGTVKVNNTVVGSVSIHKCKYNTTTKKFEVLPNTDDAGNPYLTITNNEFTIRKDSSNKYLYDTKEKDGQFTLIDVAFKDPTDTDTTNSKITYHLYVPVIVKKLLEYNFHISLSSGTSYDKALYESNFGNNLVENLGTPVTAEIKYTYLRTEAEWTAEGVDGSDFNYAKKLEFKCTADVFDDVTKLILVDANNNGKVYYLDAISTSGAFSKKSGSNNVYVLDLQKFKDVDGTAFNPVKLNALNETETVTFKDGTSGVYRTERYFLSIFTVEQAGDAIHYEITNSELSLDGFPTRRLKCECANQSAIAPHHVSHLIMGDFYENTPNVTALTEQEKMDALNTSIDVQLGATVKIKNTAKNVVNDYLDNENVTIYQTLLATLQDYVTNLETNVTNAGERGVRYLDEVAVNNYVIKHYDSQGNLLTDQISVAPIPGANYVELPNNRDISKYLKNNEVVIESNITLKYYTESNRTAEFPYNTEDSNDNSGAAVMCFSNISSKAEMAAYSNVSKSEEDQDRKYYNAASISTTLNFNASYPSNHSQDNQLGINALDVTGTTAEIRTVGIYDVSKLSDIQSADYILCEIELDQKTKAGESYNAISDISTYINGFTVCGKAQGTDDTVVYRDDTSGRKYTFILNRSKVDSSTANNVYSIPINFTVYTGNNEKFEQKSGGGLQYGNYKVRLSTTLLNSYELVTNNGTTTLSLDTIGKSNATDFVIYTNARVYADLIK